MEKILDSHPILEPVTVETSAGGYYYRILFAALQFMDQVRSALTVQKLVEMRVDGNRSAALEGNG